MSELTVTFSAINDPDNSTVQSSASTATTSSSAIINNDIKDRSNSMKGKSSKSKNKRRSNKIVPLPSTNLNLSTAAMRLWYASIASKTDEDAYNSSSNGSVKASLSSLHSKEQLSSSQSLK